MYIHMQIIYSPGGLRRRVAHHAGPAWLVNSNHTNNNNTNSNKDDNNNNNNDNNNDDNNNDNDKT